MEFKDRGKKKYKSKNIMKIGIKRDWHRRGFLVDCSIFQTTNKSSQKIFQTHRDPYQSQQFSREHAMQVITAATYVA